MLEQKLTDDIKTAMLAGEKDTVITLRGLKAALLSAKVADGTRDSAMSDDQVIQIFSKEAKKRQESADLYVQGGNQEKAAAELSEKALIETYLPAQLSESEVIAIIDAVITETGNDKSKMGQIIGGAKAKAGPSADGSLIAKLVKERLNG